MSAVWNPQQSQVPSGTRSNHKCRQESEAIMSAARNPEQSCVLSRTRSNHKYRQEPGTGLLNFLKFDRMKRCLIQCYHLPESISSLYCRFLLRTAEREEKEVGQSPLYRKRACLRDETNRVERVRTQSGRSPERNRMFPTTVQRIHREGHC